MAQMTWFRRLTWIAVGITLIVIVLGAWVRLTGAGLGCPDWPGCYGMITWPNSTEEIESANEVWGHERPVEVGKAIREMVHRYAATLLGLIAIILTVLAWRNRADPNQLVWFPTGILALIIIQGIFGALTVTLLLKPAIVTTHLIGGMTTFALLLLLALRSNPARIKPPSLPARTQFGAVLITLLVLIMQIFLGGWVSTNYAALACPDFPTCMGQWWPEMDFAEGFQLWRGVGYDFQGGVLDQSARAAIHFIHRIWALVVVATFIWLFLRLWRIEDLRKPALLMMFLLTVQVLIGIYNIVGGLPLANAVAHNGMAALLLGTMIWLLDKTRLRRGE
ncbi:MAG: COX15/CtaA family protein [Pseudomonadota bacterium]